MAGAAIVLVDRAPRPHQLHAAHRRVGQQQRRLRRQATGSRGAGGWVRGSAGGRGPRGGIGCEGGARSVGEQATAAAAALPFRREHPTTHGFQEAEGGGQRVQEALARLDVGRHACSRGGRWCVGVGVGGWGGVGVGVGAAARQQLAVSAMQLESTVGSGSSNGSGAVEQPNHRQVDPAPGQHARPRQGGLRHSAPTPPQHPPTQHPAPSTHLPTCWRTGSGHCRG